jgi:hypothetical protein
MAFYFVPFGPRDVCRPHHPTADNVIWHNVFSILGVSPEVQTHDNFSYSTRQLSLPADFGGLNVPPLSLDDELVLTLHSTLPSPPLLPITTSSR